MPPFDLETYLQIPYEPHGRSLDGMDCWGLVLHFYKEQFDIELYDQSYDENWYKNHNFILGQAEDKGFYEVNQPEQLGDILLFKIGSRVPNHCGIWVPEESRILHCERKSKCSYEPYRARLREYHEHTFRHGSEPAT